jgi:hypothetical protein
LIKNEKQKKRITGGGGGGNKSSKSKRSLVTDCEEVLDTLLFCSMGA